ncbi:hypothetical protein AAC387_Pa02g2811 [Persea americana]
MRGRAHVESLGVRGIFNLEEAHMMMCRKRFYVCALDNMMNLLLEAGVSDPEPLAGRGRFRSGRGISVLAFHKRGGFNRQ